MHFQWPRRPKVRDPRANAVLDWAETCAYIFWLIFAAVVAVTLLVHGWDFAAQLPFRP